MPPHRITNSVDVPFSDIGCWVNATNWHDVNECVTLLKSSTVHANADPNASVGVYLKNIQLKRAALWLWTGFDSDKLITVAFHGADGPKSARYCVCAGVDKSFETKAAAPVAAAVWMEAVKQFAKINSDTKNIYLWYAKDEEPKEGDQIFEAFNIVTRQTSGKNPETYSQTHVRWPENQSTWLFDKL